MTYEGIAVGMGDQRLSVQSLSYGIDSFSAEYEIGWGGDARSWDCYARRSKW